MTSEQADETIAVQCRGIYATALTHLLGDTDDISVVRPSPPIQRRFETDFASTPPDVTIVPDDDRLGVGLVGPSAAVDRVADRLDVALDTFSWSDSTPQDAVFEGVVSETLGSGAIVDLGVGDGFLPFSATDAHIETGDRLRVQIADPVPPWTDDRPVLASTLSVRGTLATLVAEQPTQAAGPDLLDVLSVEIPEGWRVSWDHRADDADFGLLEAELEGLIDRVDDLDRALKSVEDNVDTGTIVEGWATRWIQFGRQSRFSLDEHRRDVTATMPGHHRIKAGDERASAAVDFVEELAPALDGEFPFAVVTRQFGPTQGDQIAIAHGKPDGRTVSLGRGSVIERETGGRIRVEREMSPGGTYDGLGVDREAGDVAITTFTEGKWWYPTVYRGEDGTKRGTYVNVCTPVEIFPDEVRYVDLHVDVLKHAEGTVERVDDDELGDAVDAGHVSEPLAEKARSVASAVENALSPN